MSKKFKYVEVVWKDARSVAEWVDVTDSLPTPVPCVSRGWLVEDNSEYVVLASTLALTDSGMIFGCGEIIAIPKGGFTQKIKRLKV